MGGIIYPTSLTAQDVRFRLLQICAELAKSQPDILKTVVFDNDEQFVAAGRPLSGMTMAECHLSPDDLPALAGITVGAAPLRTGANRNRQITRNYSLLVLFYQLCNDSMEEQAAAFSALWSRIDELPDYFASTVVGNLRHNDSGLRGIASIGHMADEGTESAVLWLGNTYSAATYTLPVTTSRGGI